MKIYLSNDIINAIRETILKLNTISKRWLFMHSLIFLDLMGTLLEARHVACRSGEEYEYKQEYLSRIMYVSRKLNSLLKNNIVVINTAVDHCEVNDLYLILSDIDKYIDCNLKENIHYYISCGENTDNNSPKLLWINDKQVIKMVMSKQEIYSEMLEQYYNLFPVAVDDNILFGENDGLKDVYEKSGRLCIIFNPLNSVVTNSKTTLDYKNRYYPYADNDSLIAYYINSYSQANNYDINQRKVFEEKVYKDFKDGNVDIRELAFFGIKENTKRYFTKHGFDTKRIEDSIHNNRITYVSSFEEAYQKVLKYLI